MPQQKGWIARHYVTLVKEDVPREHLRLRLLRRGVVERTGRGLYRTADAPITEFHSLAEGAKRLPSGTVCLLSALVFHGITTQVRGEVGVALARGSRTPRLDRKLRVIRSAGAALTEGRTEHRIEIVPETT